MGWHNSYERLREELISTDDEIAELKAEIAELRHENQQLKEILAAHSVHAFSPELADYRAMHPQEE